MSFISMACVVVGTSEDFIHLICLLLFPNFIFAFIFQILLVTLKAASPSIVRFGVCVSLLFAGFMFCGWIVFGPFHPKVRKCKHVERPIDADPANHLSSSSREGRKALTDYHVTNQATDRLTKRLAD